VPTEHILDLLIAERDKLSRAIEALRGPVKKRGAGARNTSATAAVTATPAGTRKRRPMSAAKRKAQSERMKAFWAKRRKNVS